MPSSLSSRRAVPPSHTNDNICACPHCSRLLQIKTAKGGRSPGSRYLHCNNPVHKDYWRWFGPEPATRSPTAAASSPVLAALGSSSHTPASLVDSSLTPAIHATMCRDAHCQSTLVNRNCIQKKCKRHCMSSGGCSCAGHHPTTSVSAPLSVSAPPALSAPAVHHRWRGSFVDDLAALAPDFTPTPTIMRSRQEELYRSTHPHWFESPSLTLAPPPPPSPFPISVVLVDFARHGHSATVHSINVSSWTWIRPGTQPYEAYSADYFRWMPVPASYPHNLRRQRRLLIRSRGITGSNEDEHIARLLSEADSDTDQLFPLSLYPLATSSTHSAHPHVKRHISETDIIEIDDSSDEEQPPRKKRAKGKGKEKEKEKMVEEELIVDNDDDDLSVLSSTSTSSHTS
ncbi:hypothetical protein C8J57DRAFT_1344415 [Mycena rebaudengoi]|nr:hypothetical protein C8J57DRAFT_1344415 [Mycena rebaudengoi]